MQLLDRICKFTAEGLQAHYFNGVDCWRCRRQSGGRRFLSRVLNSDIHLPACWAIQPASDMRVWHKVGAVGRD